MQAISRKVQEGAAAFLKAEYRWLAVFVVVVAAAIGFSSAENGLGPKTAVAFVCGAFASGLAGYFGMHTATRAAVRTTQAARDQPDERALGVRFCFRHRDGHERGRPGAARRRRSSPTSTRAANFDAEASNHVLGFSFGASSIALFARVGGGIFTKAADVGADLVGKVEAGIPEDDPRNPGTIADNVGDNVGDVAGMGADLFESYVGSIIAAMALRRLPSSPVRRTCRAWCSCRWRSPASASSPRSSAPSSSRRRTSTRLHSALFRGLLVASALVIVALWSS